MVKEFSDMEFRMYGDVQSFFYRCWTMWGSHPESNRTTATTRKLEMMRTWCNRLFPSETTHYANVTFLTDDGLVIPYNHTDQCNVIQLTLQLSRALNFEVFVVDLRHNLEDYDFYNIKWVSNVETNLNRLSETPTHTYKAVPKVFK